MYFFEELSRGADGAMTGFPYPEALRGIRDDFVAGRRDEARALFYRWLPLIRYETQPGATPGTAVGIRKEILRRRGFIACALVRPPAPGSTRRRRPSWTELLAAILPERRAPRPGQRRPPLLPGDRRARARPLVLIMGWGGDHTAWALQAPAFAAEHRVIALDNRGAGQSDAPSMPYTIAGMAADVAGLLDALGTAAPTSAAPRWAG